MPTLNPRVSVTLRPEVSVIFKRLSSLTGNSQSAIIGELLNSSLPVFERMVSLLEAAQKLKAEGMAVPEEINTSLLAAHERLEEQLGIAFDLMDEGSRPLLVQAEGVSRRAGRAGAASVADGPALPAVAATPLSNRGVTPLAKRHKPTGKPRSVAPRRELKNGPV